jgi:uncharacterized damage-inducible protein DinB
MLEFGREQPHVANDQVRLLLEVMARAYDRRSWHGTNLRGAIRGLAAAVAARRPGPGRHNIWELVVHAAYWKYAVRRRLTGEKRGSFPLAGSDWFLRPDPHDESGTSEAAWRSDVALLYLMHRQLAEAVAGLRDSDLQRPSAGSSVTKFELIAGIAAHDLYHAGQIQLIKRLR